MLAVVSHKFDMMAHVFMQKNHITLMDLVRKMLEKRFIAQNLCKIQSNTGETIYCASFWLLAFVIAVKKK